jgi:hypothetical protein
MIVFSDDVEIAKIVSKYRPNCVGFYPTLDEQKIKHIRYVRGIYALYVSQKLSVDDIIKGLFNSPYEPFITRGEKILILNVYLHSKLKIRNGFYIKNVV